MEVPGEHGMHAALGECLRHGGMVGDDVVLEVPRLAVDVLKQVVVHHGDGRILISNELAHELFEKGQVFTQYCDEKGVPAISEPDNPNGSAFAIEGLTSPDGHVLGKMGHNERTIGKGKGGSSVDLIKNIAFDPLTNPDGNSCQNIFAAGVRYFN